MKYGITFFKSIYCCKVEIFHHRFRCDWIKSPGTASPSANNLLFRRVAPPRKTKPTLVAASTKVDGRKNEERVSSVAEKIQRRGRHSVGLSANISRAHTPTHTHARAHTCARIHTFLPACSRVQIGIEKSRSQLKLEAQRIRRDKIPIISCPRLSSSPALSFPCPVDGEEEKVGIVGGGGRAFSLARTQFH